MPGGSGILYTSTLPSKRVIARYLLSGEILVSYAKVDESVPSPKSAGIPLAHLIVN